jgi:UDP:flavonoid glycosyltransferase YjiC (YdhE family)
MQTIGICGPPLLGHLNPLLALGAALRARGHRVLAFNIADVENQIRAHELEFVQIGARDFPLGSLPAWQAELRRQRGLRLLIWTGKLLDAFARVVLREVRVLAERHGVDGLVHDRAEFGICACFGSARSPRSTC